jgi:diacylglycerol kinase family enzyme
MRVSLFHNHRAGDSTSLSWIRELIETSGHELVRVFDREAAFGELVDQRTELVVAAGGDGTAAAAARLLAGHTIPLAILPFGTANNIARALEGDATPEQLVSGWDRAVRRRVDLGMARGHWGEHRFMEGVGVGLGPATIVSTRHEPLDGDDASSNISSAIDRYSEVLRELRPCSWTLRLDGDEMTGDFLAVQVMNIRSVGPNLVLAHDADPCDGYFSVVTAKEEHRDELARYLQDRIEGRESRLTLPTRYARHVELLGRGDAHVDDEVLRSAISGTVSIQIEPAAVEVLVCQ